MVLRNREWNELWQVAGDNPIFSGPVAEWSADQRRLVAVTKEYSNALSALQTRGHDTPDQDILGSYRRFRAWWAVYIKNPDDVGNNPYRRYQHGFSTKAY